MNEEQTKLVNTQLQNWAEKTKTDVNLLKTEFETQVKTITDTFELSEEEIINFALARVQASLRKKLVTSAGKGKFEGVFLGTDGRLMNWSDIYRAKTMRMMEGLTTEEQIAKGYIDKDGNLLYPPNSSQFRKGKKISDNEYSFIYEAVVKQTDGSDSKKLYSARIDIKVPELCDKIKMGKLLMFEATKSGKSTEDRLMLRVDSGEIAEKPNVLTPTELINLYEMAFNRYEINFDTLINKAESADKLPIDEKNITIRGMIIRRISENLGANLSTLVELDTPTIDSPYATITVWLPKECLTTLIETNPINVYGRLRGVSEDKLSIVMNGLAVWYDTKFLPKEVPAKIEELEDIAESNNDEVNPANKTV